MSFEFILATLDDRAYLLNLRKLTMVEHLENSGQFLSDAEHEIRLDDAYACSHLIIFKGKIIGTLKYQEDDCRVEIMQIQIHPDFQGQGLGKKVMQQVLVKARNKTVELTVLKDNPALKLYQRLGFTITGEDEYEYHMQATKK
ncbi:GNAT family N-acetyltransferase [Shewanella psychropiezotolerans]|uniref:GNAT family N-acetyltransferase n=1 Tax=Shewanella psychropiezotolerans TaxID=2593655 RepID=A0ABX5X0E4_9GAMM|nr:GNAT family N-acetyltransferase [Shewanella psychropiezotolerans]QDO84818.1 GNAT family N-acetyltransferase [Shewanella psychropiezotolerans]